MPICFLFFFFFGGRASLHFFFCVLYFDLVDGLLLFFFLFLVYCMYHFLVFPFLSFFFVVWAVGWGFDFGVPYISLVPLELCRGFFFPVYISIV
jgi:hypothetical protein